MGIKCQNKIFVSELQNGVLGGVVTMLLDLQSLRIEFVEAFL